MDGMRPDKDRAKADRKVELRGDALLQSEEFVQIALECFAEAVRDAAAETDRIEATKRNRA